MTRYVGPRVTGIFFSSSPERPMRFSQTARLNRKKGLVVNGSADDSNPALAARLGSTQRRLPIVSIATDKEITEASSGMPPFGFVPGDARRNITVTGVNLAGLQGEHFKIGDALLQGIELPEPREFMVDGVPDSRRPALLAVVGLVAVVKTAGTIRVGSSIAIADHSELVS